MITYKQLREIGFSFTSKKTAAIKTLRGQMVFIGGYFSLPSNRKELMNWEHLPLFILRAKIRELNKPECIYAPSEVTYFLNRGWEMKFYMGPLPVPMSIYPVFYCQVEP